MDRNIEFKAMKDDMSNCNFVFGQLVYDAAGQPRITEVDSSGQGLIFHTCLKNTECQFTGLIDKNEKRIFEGDIVQCGYGIGKVVFQAGCFMIQWLDDKEAYLEFVFSRKGMHSRRHDEVLEIIGNVFQSPELLGVSTPDA